MSAAQASTVAHARRCAEGEGGRARLAMEGYANADTAAYFAREAAHWAQVVLAADGTVREVR